jgi:hypothetical protein
VVLWSGTSQYGIERTTDVTQLCQCTWYSTVHERWRLEGLSLSSLTINGEACVGVTGSSYIWYCIGLGGALGSSEAATDVFHIDECDDFHRQF